MNGNLVSRVLLLALCLTAQSLTAAELERGDREASFSLGLEHEQGAGTYLAISGEYGFMISSRHEVGPVLSLGYSNPDWPGAGSSTWGGAGAFYRYNIPNRTKALVPFLGVRALGFFGDLDSYSSEVQADAGLRVMPAPAASVNLAVFYRETFFRSDWYHEHGSNVGMTAGISIFF